MKKIISINPATGESNGEFELYSENRVNCVIKKAKAAFSEWKILDISDRSEYLKKAARVLLKGKKDLGETITKEMGKPIKESVPEIEKCAWVLEYFAENAGRLLEPEVVETENLRTCPIINPEYMRIETVFFS